MKCYLLVTCYLNGRLDTFVPASDRSLPVKSHAQTPTSTYNVFDQNDGFVNFSDDFIEVRRIPRDKYKYLNTSIKFV